MSIKRIIVSSYIILVAVFSFLAGHVAAQPSQVEAKVKVEAKVDKTSVNVGDKIKYTITILTDKKTEIQMPDDIEKKLAPLETMDGEGKAKMSLTGFTIKDSGSTTSSFWGRKKIVQWYSLAAYTTGKLKIPKLAIKYRAKPNQDWQQVETAEQKIQVQSLLGKAVGMRDIKGPLNFSSRFNAISGPPDSTILPPSMMWTKSGLM